MYLGYGLNGIDAKHETFNLEFQTRKIRLALLMHSSFINSERIAPMGILRCQCKGVTFRWIAGTPNLVEAILAC